MTNSPASAGVFFGKIFIDQGRSADASDSALKKNCVKREVLLRGARDSRYLCKVIQIVWGDS